MRSLPYGRRRLEAINTFQGIISWFEGYHIERRKTWTVSSRDINIVVRDRKLRSLISISFEQNEQAQPISSQCKLSDVFITKRNNESSYPKFKLI